MWKKILKVGGEEKKDKKIIERVEKSKKKQTVSLDGGRNEDEL